MVRLDRLSGAPAPVCCPLGTASGPRPCFTPNPCHAKLRQQSRRLQGSRALSPATPALESSFKLTLSARSTTPPVRQHRKAAWHSSPQIARHYTNWKSMRTGADPEVVCLLHATSRCTDTQCSCLATPRQPNQRCPPAPSWWPCLCQLVDLPHAQGVCGTPTTMYPICVVPSCLHCTQGRELCHAISGRPRARVAFGVRPDRCSAAAAAQRGKARRGAASWPPVHRDCFAFRAPLCLSL